MKKYACIFFDLDHTLWDFEANSAETLEVLFHQHRLREKGISSFPFFIETFVRVNTYLWDLHDRGLIGPHVIREERFHRVLSEAGLDDYRLSQKISEEYLDALPHKKSLIPEALETLEYLFPKYPMVIVTNGFDELQSTKMKSAGIKDYFRHVVTSQRAGNRKPSKEIFEFALNESGFNPSQSIMIGDNLLTDIVGARSAGLDTIYFNPAGKTHDEQVTHEITRLNELRTLL
ncbi:MAG TPA: YjjG family noncanonical pyrimidine nucleotidase [Cyclobacteriaceae bacterium]|nr:YjjG family noncanonical pyrimidine nucleotidase [Cyclobacteriaceae bacterium]